jgi:hypothetical protein
LQHLRHNSMDSAGSHDLAQQQQSGSSKAHEQGRHGGSRLRPAGQPVHHSDSFCAEAGQASPSEIYAR